MHQIIIPKSKLLRKYILSFNILNEFDSIKPINYYAFPQRGITVGFFKDAHIDISNDRILIEKKREAVPKAILLGKYLNPLRISYKSYVQKISIHFTETGINHFIPNYFEDYAGEHAQIIALAELDIDCEGLFQTKFYAGIAYLEVFLLNKFKFIEMEQLDHSIALIWEDPTIQTKELALQVALTEKTLNRRFQKFVGCKTSEFKRIVKFKKTMEDYFGPNFKNLTALCYDNEYYDASHFYKQIIATTDFSPREFFENIKKMGLENHIYILD